MTVTATLNHSQQYLIFFYNTAAAGGQWQTDTWKECDRHKDRTSLLIPVYSKWKPVADTLMSDWKVKYRLLDVLFSSCGIVVPVSYNKPKKQPSIHLEDLSPLKR